MTHQKKKEEKRNPIETMLQNIYVDGNLYLSESLDRHVQIKTKMHV